LQFLKKKVKELEAKSEDWLFGVVDLTNSSDLVLL